MTTVARLPEQERYEVCNGQIFQLSEATQSVASAGGDVDVSGTALSEVSPEAVIRALYWAEQYLNTTDDDSDEREELLAALEELTLC